MLENVDHFLIRQSQDRLSSSCSTLLKEMYHHNFVLRLQGHFCIGNVHWSRCHLQICVTSYSTKAQKIFILHLELASYLLLTSSIKVWGHFSHWYVCWTWSMKLLDLKCYSLCPIVSQLSVSFVTILLSLSFPFFWSTKRLEWQSPANHDRKRNYHHLAYFFSYKSWLVL